MALQRLHQFGLERRATACGAERPIARRAAGTARDLGQFGRVKLAELISVEFAVGRKRHVIDVEIEAHADRIGRDQIVDVARLIERDLRVAGARRERAEHDRGAAALAADQFGDLVNFGRRERHDRGAARQAGELFLAGEVQCRQPRARYNVRAGKQLLDHVAHGRGAEHQRFLAAAPVEHAVGEHVPALEIGAELHFVDRHERHVEIARHRLDGRDPEARAVRLDLLFAGDERDRLRPDALDALVVDLARKQAQRQPDHAARMREHPLDREMRLAGVGRTEHRGHAGTARAHVAGRMGRKRYGHQESRSSFGNQMMSRATIWKSSMPASCGGFLVKHDLFRKPVSIPDRGRGHAFRDHAFKEGCAWHMGLPSAIRRVEPASRDIRR